MGNKEKEFISKHHRKKPIKEIDANQTLHNLAYNEDINNKKINFIFFRKQHNIWKII